MDSMTPSGPKEGDIKVFLHCGTSFADSRSCRQNRGRCKVPRASPARTAPAALVAIQRLEAPVRKIYLAAES
jgi:hypothetical protein